MQHFLGKRTARKAITNQLTQEGKRGDPTVPNKGLQLMQTFIQAFKTCHFTFLQNPFFFLATSLVHTLRIGRL